MISSIQCELARKLTGDVTGDKQINSEYLLLTQTTKDDVANQMDALIKLHDAPFDKAFSILKQDFADIAKMFNISPATLFCVYVGEKITADQIFLRIILLHTLNIIRHMRSDV